MHSDTKQSPIIARVISEFKEAYQVKDASNKEYYAKITGKRIFKASSREDYPAVGDWVSITTPDGEHATINEILPRTNSIKRIYGNKTQIIATNIDIAFIVESVDRDYNLNRFERYFVIAENGGVKPAIIINKIDLISKEDLEKILAQLKNRFPDTDIILTSTVKNDGLDELKKYIIKDKTYCFLGSSGVGKSTLINNLLEKNSIKTGDISSYSGRGKHITTNRQMYFLKNGGIVIDNPGMREVGVASNTDGIDISFDEITTLSKKCKYTDCTHIHEPDCEILKAVKSGKLNKEKYDNYINLKKESEYYEMDEIEKKEKDHKFGKFLKKAKKELREIRDK